MSGIYSSILSPLKRINVCIIFGLCLIFSEHAFATLNGSEIIKESVTRHQLFPYVYEKQTMIMTDRKNQVSVRTLTRYTRMDKEQGVRTLLVFNTPQEIKGVSLLAIRSMDGTENNRIFLPAFSAQMKQLPGNKYQNQLLGSDFTLADLSPEDQKQFIYVRLDDVVRNEISYYLVDAEPVSSTLKKQLGYTHKRHLVRKDNFFIIQSDYLDHKGELIKRLSHHSLKLIDDKYWRANMILMENFPEQHNTLLKISDRIFSADYVPEELFNSDNITSAYSVMELNEPAE